MLFLDDIFVFFFIFEEYLERLEDVFKRFERYSLILKLLKCDFFMLEVKYFGYVVLEKGN